jgi:hypothetical protein
MTLAGKPNEFSPVKSKRALDGEAWPHDIESKWPARAELPEGFGPKE